MTDPTILVLLSRRNLGQGDFHAEICDQVDGDGRSTPDYLTVSIGFGDSLCTQSYDTTTSNEESTSAVSSANESEGEAEPEPEPEPEPDTATTPVDNDDDYYYDDYGR